jgi:hypothetical protein
MTIMQSPDGVEPFLNEELPPGADDIFKELATWRQQTPASALETQPATITGDKPYDPPYFLPDGADELTPQEYQAVFGADAPPPPRDPILARLDAIDGKLTTITGDVSTVKGEITTIREDIRILTGRVKALEERLPKDGAGTGKPTSTSN